MERVDETDMGIWASIRSMELSGECPLRITRWTLYNKKPVGMIMMKYSVNWKDNIKDNTNSWWRVAETGGRTRGTEERGLAVLVHQDLLLKICAHLRRIFHVCLIHAITMELGILLRNRVHSRFLLDNEQQKINSKQRMDTFVKLL